MTALEAACALARRFEGCSLTPYRDACGYWTIGWGHLLTHDLKAPAPDMVWTQEQADAALESDMSQFVEAVRSLAGNYVGANGLAALSDFAFNLGLRSLRASTLYRMVRDGDMAGAAGQFQKWVFGGGRKLPGLVKRREAERDLFLHET